MIRTKFLVEFFFAQKIVFVVVEKTIWSRIKFGSGKNGQQNCWYNKYRSREKVPTFFNWEPFSFLILFVDICNFLWEDIVQSCFSLNISTHEVPWPHLVRGLS